MSEADIHFELYRHLKNAIEQEPQRGSVTYSDVVAEYGDGVNGYADLVLFDSQDDPVAVIEAKAPDDSSRGRKEIDPYSPKVIRQAFGYAGDIGASYFCTFNGDRLVVFDAYDEGVPLLQRSTKSYEISGLEQFADTLLDELSRLQAGDTQWDTNDDVFVDRVRVLHEQLTPRLETELTDQLDGDAEFASQFDEWTTTQGIDYDDAGESDQAVVRQEFADQAAYLLINKIIFYKILEDSPTYADEVRPLAVSPFRVQADLNEYFDTLVREVDFEAIFDHDEIYSEIPLNSVSETVREFIIELDEQDLTQFDSDVIGRIYEGVIPAEQRREMGEYYTPPAICELITRLTVTDGNDAVLDPACGSGGFLISAYDRKRDLLPESQASHDHVLSQLMGVDINRFPAHLSAINLAIQDLDSHTKQVNVEVRDFFEVEPDTMRLGRERAGTGGSEQEDELGNVVGGFDAVVGNPPYIRGRSIDLDHKSDIREHLSAVDAEWMTKVMDLYGYFLTHSTAFLKDGGRLGFIVSDRWLDTRYGTDLQRFLLENYKIEAIIKFNRQAFEDALVGASILILEKDPDDQRRDNTVVKSIEVREELDLDEVESLVEADHEDGQMIVSDTYRVVTNRQATLRDVDKWNVFFMAPPVYFDIIRGAETVELQEVADLHTGKESGANDFFYRRQEAIEDLGLGPYTSPLLKATGQVDTIEFDAADAEEWGILDVQHLVEAALDEEQTFGESEMAHIKGWLDENDHDALREYIEQGEEQEYHTSSASCRKRDVWFALDELAAYRPPIAVPDFVWTESRAILNTAGAVTDRQFHNVVPNDDVDETLLAALLNSRLVWLARELEGRHAGGQGMTRSRMVLYEVEQLSIPDPRTFSAAERERILEAFDALRAREAELDPDAPLDAKTEERDALDRAVLATVGLEEKVDDLRTAVRQLVDIRRDNAGENTEVLIARDDGETVIDLEGVADVRETTRLDDF